MIPSKPLTPSQKAKIKSLRQLFEQRQPRLGKRVIARTEAGDVVGAGEVVGYYNYTIAIRTDRETFTWPAGLVEVVSDEEN